MKDPNNNDVELRLVGTDRPARVVVAEVDAPGSLQYLVEAEGCRVVGSASGERDLARILEQDIGPDVIVLDADVAATSVVVARQLASSAHVIVIWPDGVQAPSGAERVSPARLYEDLGPAIRRHMDKRRVPEPVIALPTDASPAPLAIAASGAAVGRAASRVSVTTVTLIVAVLLTMGASFALGGYRARLTAETPRIVAPKASVHPDSVASGPTTGRDASPLAPVTSSNLCGSGRRTVAAVAGCGNTSDKAHHDHRATSGRRHAAAGLEIAAVASGWDQGGDPPAVPVSDPGTQGEHPGDQGEHPGNQGEHPGNQGEHPGDHGEHPGDHGGSDHGQGGGGDGGRGGNGGGDHEDDVGKQDDEDEDDHDEDEDGDDDEGSDDREDVDESRDTESDDQD